MLLMLPFAVAIAFAFHVAAGTQLVVQSESLRNFRGCTIEQQNQIYTAWNEAIDLSREAYRWISSGSVYAKRDYIGGDGYVDDASWNRVKGLIYYATTYGLAGKNSPFPTWEVNITCSDWLNKCDKSGLMAYTSNPESRGGVRGIYMDTITFCPNGAFLKNGTKIQSCPVRRAMNEKNRVLDMNDFQCWGCVVLHEIFHLRSLSSRVPAKGSTHITDLYVEFYKANDKRGPKLKTPAYGAIATKILANYRTDSGVTGEITTQNADNLAQFCLSLWIEYTGYSKLYPAAPRVNEVGIDWGISKYASFDFDGTLILNTTAIDADSPSPMMSYLSTDDVCNDIDDTDDCLVSSYTVGSSENISINTPISFTGTPGFGNGSDYPYGNLSAYLETNATATSIPISQPTSLRADPSFFCYAGLGQNILYQPFVSQAFAQESITKMCSEIANLALDPTDSPSISVPFAPDPNTDTLLWLEASWQVGDPTCEGTRRAPSTTECVSELSHILNDCDTNSITNKYGGTHLNNCIDWEMWVNATLPASHAMKCVLDPEEDICSCTDGVLPVFIVSVDPAGGCGMLYG